VRCELLDLVNVGLVNKDGASIRLIRGNDDCEGKSRKRIASCETQFIAQDIGCNCNINYRHCRILSSSIEIFHSINLTSSIVLNCQNGIHVDFKRCRTRLCFNNNDGCTGLELIAILSLSFRCDDQQDHLRRQAQNGTDHHRNKDSSQVSQRVWIFRACARKKFSFKSRSGLTPSYQLASNG
jgi:hypothetical protein